VGILTVRRLLVAVTVLAMVAATVTFDVPYRLWYRLGGGSGTSDGLSYTVTYRISGDGHDTVTFRTPDGDLTESIYQSATRDVQAWSEGDVARISVQAGLTGGAVGCEILVNGVVEDTGSGGGPQAVATCSARVRMNG
jgi:hypothetical protein